MTEDRPAITAPGGFCAPPGYELNPVAPAAVSDAFPRVTVQRGGAFFPKPGTPEWEQAEMERATADRIHQMIARHIGGILEAQNRALDDACLEALERGWDVHVQRPSYSSRPSRFLGIELAERTNGRSFPTLHEHSDDWRWEEMLDEY